MFKLLTDFHVSGTVVECNGVLSHIEAHTDDQTIAGALSYAMSYGTVV